MFDETISLISIWTSMNSWLTPTILFLFLNLMIGTIFITSTFNSPKTRNQQPQPQPQSQLTRVPSVLHRLKSINFYSYYSQTHQPESDPFHNSSPDPHHERNMVQPAAVQSAKFMHESGPRPQVTQGKTWASAIQPVQSAKFMHESGPRPLVPESKTRVPAIQEDFTDDEGPTFDEIYSRIKGISSSGHNRQNSDTLPMSGDIPVRLPAKMKKSASDESAFNHFEAENAAPPTTEEREITAAIIAAAAGGSGEEVDARADDFINRFKKELQLQRIESIVRYKDMITRGSAQ